MELKATKERINDERKYSWEVGMKYWKMMEFGEDEGRSRGMDRCVITLIGLIMKIRQE